jgi:hypothetical protein
MFTIREVIDMKKFILFLITFMLISCDFDVPQNPFLSLKNEEVTGPIAYLDNNIAQYNRLEFNATIPDDIQSLTAQYRWKIINIFDETIIESDKKQFSVESGLPAEEYKVILTIIDTNGNKRSFSKEFTVTFHEVDGELILEKLSEADDTGIENTDAVTNKNSELTFFGSAPVDTEVTLKIINVFMDTTTTFAANVDAEGAVSVTTDAATVFDDGSYEVYLIRSSDSKKSSMPLYLVIDTEAPVIEWASEEPSENFEFGDDVSAFGKTVSADIVFEYNRTGNFASLEELKTFDSFTAGTQNITITGLDNAGNESTPLTRSLTVNAPVVTELVKDGTFEHANEGELSSYWKIQIEGFLFSTIIGRKSGWELGTVTSEAGGKLQYEDSSWQGYMLYNDSDELVFKDSFSASGTLRWISRTKGFAYQIVQVKKGITYTASVDTQFFTSEHPNHHCWNTLAVTSSALGLNFTEGNIDFYSFEPTFGSGTAIRTVRVYSDDNEPGENSRPEYDNSQVCSDHSQTVNLTLEFTPDADGNICVGVIKSDICDGSNRDNGASRFDNLSIQATSWNTTE